MSFNTTTSTSNHSTKKSKSLRPPPNTPLESTFPAFSNPFKSTLPTFFEPPSYDEDDTEADVPYTLTAYGTLAPSESYAPIPIPPPTSTYKSTLSSSPKRTANGCLQLRTPIRRPALPTRNTFSGFSGSAGYCRVVIGCANSPCPSPIATSSTYPGFLGSAGPSSSGSYLTIPKSSSSASLSPSSPSPPSPLPLPVPIRSHTRTKPKAIVHLHSDSDTEVESDADSSDTCASGSDGADSDNEGWLKLNLPRSISMEDVLRGKAAAVQVAEAQVLALKMKFNSRPLPVPGWRGEDDDVAVPM